MTLRFLTQKRQRNILNDMERMESELAGRGVDWTVVRCAPVRESASSGVTVAKAGLESTHVPVRAEGVARYVLYDAIAPELVGTAVTLAGSS